MSFRILDYSCSFEPSEKLIPKKDSIPKQKSIDTQLIIPQRVIEQADVDSKKKIEALIGNIRAAKINALDFFKKLGNKISDNRIVPEDQKKDLYRLIFLAIDIVNIKFYHDQAGDGISPAILNDILTRIADQLEIKDDSLRSQFLNDFNLALISMNLRYQHEEMFRSNLWCIPRQVVTTIFGAVCGAAVAPGIGLIVSCLLFIAYTISIGSFGTIDVVNKLNQLLSTNLGEYVETILISGFIGAIGGVASGATIGSLPGAIIGMIIGGCGAMLIGGAIEGGVINKQRFDKKVLIKQYRKLYTNTATSCIEALYPGQPKLDIKQIESLPEWQNKVSLPWLIQQKNCLERNDFEFLLQNLSRKGNRLSFKNSTEAFYNQSFNFGRRNPKGSIRAPIMG